jgi:hypothetical protein
MLDAIDVYFLLWSAVQRASQKWEGNVFWPTWSSRDPDPAICNTKNHVAMGIDNQPAEKERAWRRRPRSSHRPAWEVVESNTVMSVPLTRTQRKT